MGKRTRQIEDLEESPRKKSRNRIVIYSSDEITNDWSTSDDEPILNSCHVDTYPHSPPSLRVQDESTKETDLEPVSQAVADGSDTPAAAVVDDTEVGLDDDILILLGDAPEPETSFGKAVHKDVATRWIDIVKKGLSKELKEKLSKEYLVPKNCELLVPPILNPEAKAALTDVFVKRDASLMYRQKQISNAMSALAQAVEAIISSCDDQQLKQKILKPVNDSCRILCDMYHYENTIRRKFVISSINTGMKDALVNSITDKYLFGENMTDKLKTAKSVQKSGETLKQSQKSPFHKSIFLLKNKGRPYFKTVQQKAANKQDPGPSRAPPASRYQNSGSSSGQYSRGSGRAPHRPRSPPPHPPPPQSSARRPWQTRN